MKTTMIYAKVGRKKMQKVKSPFDNMQAKNFNAELQLKKMASFCQREKENKAAFRINR